MGSGRSLCGMVLTLSHLRCHFKTKDGMGLTDFDEHMKASLPTDIKVLDSAISTSALTSIYSRVHMVNSEGLRSSGAQYASLEPHASVPLCTDLHPDQSFFAIFAYQGHWALLGGSSDTDEFHAVIYDGMPGRALPGGHNLVRHLSRRCSVPCRSIALSMLFRQEDDFTCGTIALAHLAACLDLTYYQPILTAHFHILKTSSASSGLVGYGPLPAQDLVASQLAELLVDKGVFREHVADRAQQALKKLPRSDVQQALQSKHPWAALKALGSRPTINYMWIQHDELLAKIKQKGAQQYGLQISASHKKKGGAKPGQHPVQVSPDDLELIPKSFLADDGSAIEQIAFQRIAKGQAGLAFATVQDITPYLRDGQIVSQGPLAVLTTLNIPHELTGILPVIDLVFPAMHCLTNEPVLIKGSLIQLGTVHINREKYKNAPDIAPMGGPTSRADQDLEKLELGRQTYPVSQGRRFRSRLGSRSSYTTAIQCPSWPTRGRCDHKDSIHPKGCRAQAPHRLQQDPAVLAETDPVAH